MKIYTVDKLRNPEFFSVVRNDAVTCRPIRSGDTIAICASCGAIHLLDSWEANERHCAECNSTLFADITDACLRTLRVSATEVITRNSTSQAKSHHVVTPVPHNGPTRRSVAAHTVNNAPSSTSTTVSTRRTVTAISTPEAYPTQTASRNIGGRILLWCLGIVVVAVAVIATIFFI